MAPEGRKVGSLKRRVRSQLARSEIKNCTPFWRESTFRSQNVQNTPGPDHFWKLRCRKKCMPAAVRSTFASEKAKNTSLSEHFSKLRCRKSARRCGAKHMSKSKCENHHMLTFRCGFAWQAHGIAHLVKSEQNVRVL